VHRRRESVKTEDAEEQAMRRARRANTEPYSTDERGSSAPLIAVRIYAISTAVH